MSELKPCPFCGKEVFLLDVAIQPAPDAKWDVYCRTHECFLNSGTNNMFSNREDAMIAWNTRAESPELAALRERVKLLREALEDSCETIQSHLSTMPIYTQDGWGIDRFDHEGEYCGFEPVNPDYVAQGLHELATETTLSILAALEQIKPKDAVEVRS